MQKLYENIVVIGAGMIGASFIASLQRNGVAKNIIAITHKKTHIRTLDKKGIKASIDFEKEVARADIIFVATPLSTYADIFKKINKIAKKEAIISDLGSVKNEVCNLAKKHLPGRKFVPSHPIAGSELSGTGVVIKNLFDGAKIIITKPANNNTRYIEEIWKMLGAKTEYLSPRKHDKIYALVSHIPQKIAFVFDALLKDEGVNAEEVEKKIDKKEFSSFVRLCGSNKKMWKDIFELNETYILQKEKAFCANLAKEMKFFKGDDKEFKNAKEKEYLYLAFIISRAFLNSAQMSKNLSYQGAGFRDVSAIGGGKEEMYVVGSPRAMLKLLQGFLSLYNNSLTR